MNDVNKNIDDFFSNLIPSNAGKWVNLVYKDKLNIIKDFVYPDSVKQLRPGKGKQGVKMPGGPQYIVIHDTGMIHKDDDAKGLNRYIHAQANSESGRVASWHFSIDDKDVYQHIPTDEIGWHAGDGGRAFGETKYNERTMKYDIGGGNQNGIGIETCINPGNDYELTLKRTAKLVAMLLKQYGLGLDRVKQHFDFSSKECPNVIINSKGLWDVFMKDVEAHYLLDSLGEYEIKWVNNHPEIIKESGKIITPINDTLVTLQLEIVTNEKKKKYSYETLVKGLSEMEKIEKTLFDLYYTIPRKLKGNLYLPTINNKYDTEISWISSNTNVLTNEGIFKHNDEIKSIDLTANIKANITYKKIIFNLFV